MLQGVVECEFVTLAAQTADNADREVGEIRVMPEFFPCKHIGKMHLDKRDRDRRQRVAHGNAGMRKGGRIDDDEINAVALGLLDAVDQFAFDVALVSLQRNAGGTGAIGELLIDRRQR